MRYFISFLFLFITVKMFSQNKFPFQNPKLPTDQRVKDLLYRMTVAEKAGQLNQLNGGAFTGPALHDAGQAEKATMVKDGRVGSLLNVVGVADTRAIQQTAMQSRLGIPLIFGYDVIHGYKTIFPIPLAEACSWDLPGIEKNSSIAAKEAAAAGIHWTFAPMCDISNDPRWGRVMEGAGEDPYYAGLVSAARVKGLQGNLNDNEHILSCVKHFAAYGAVEAGREYNQVDVSRVMLWNKYLPSYKAAVDAGAATVMNAFNVFDGIPASDNKFLVTDVLKNKWGFKGFLVSDWASFKESITHGYAADEKDAALKAIQAGSMMDMESKVSEKYLPGLVKEGKVTIAQLDEAVGRILYQKFKLGLFDDPYKFCNEQRESATLFSAANRAIAKIAAEKSIVLLKNNDNILPLDKNKKIALIGFYANSKDDMFDFWIGQGNSNDAVSVYDGMKTKFSNISFCNGYNADNTTSETLINEALKNAAAADVIVINIGISGKMAGEDRSLGNPVISDGQIALLTALQKTGKPVVALVSSARPLILTQAEPLVNSLVQCWILGTEHGNAIASMLAGEFNPSAKTVMSFPYAVGQIPIYYNHFNTGRPATTDGLGNWYSRYRDMPREPLYPFGYGLSFTTYAYGDVRLSIAEIKKEDKLTVTTEVTNSGKMDGEETVQLYIRDYAASVVRPVKELKAFKKIMLKAGETKAVSFILTKNELSFFDANGNSIIEPGKFSVFVGGNSKDVKQADFELK
jgi:beta-glucosidase